jgi:hypothetical protein
MFNLHPVDTQGQMNLISLDYFIAGNVVQEYQLSNWGQPPFLVIGVSHHF